MPLTTVLLALFAAPARADDPPPPETYVLQSDTTPTPTPPPPPPTLVEGTLPPLRLEPSPAERWRVVDARGVGIDTVSFARLASDTATLERFDREGRRASAAGYTLAVLGGGALATGLGLALSIPAPVHVGQQPDAGAYESYQDFHADVGEWQASTIAADARDQKVWAAALCLSAGAMTVAVVPFVGRDAAMHRHTPSTVYTEARARALIDAVNARYPVLSLSVGPGSVGVSAELP